MGQALVWALCEHATGTRNSGTTTAFEGMVGIYGVVGMNREVLSEDEVHGGEDESVWVHVERQIVCKWRGGCESVC